MGVNSEPQTELHAATIGGIVAVYYLGTLIGAIIGGVLGDRIGTLSLAPLERSSLTRSPQDGLKQSSPLAASPSSEPSCSPVR